MRPLRNDAGQAVGMAALQENHRTDQWLIQDVALREHVAQAISSHENPASRLRGQNNNSCA